MGTDTESELPKRKSGARTMIRSRGREENQIPKMGRHEANEPERGCVGVGDQPQRADLASIQDAAADAHTAALRDTVRWQALIFGANYK
jgi:hypothetical protein